MTRSALAVVFLFGIAASCRAEMVTMDFTVPGGIGIAFGTDAASLGLVPGMPMIGRFSYDPSATGTLNPDGTRVYQSPGSMTLSVGGRTFTSVANTPLRIEYHPPKPPTGPGSLPYPALVQLWASAADPGLFGGPAGSSYLNLTVYPGTGLIWGSTLPPDPFLSGSGYGIVSMQFTGPNPNSGIPALFMAGFVTSIRAVPAPEPGTLALAAIGAALVLGRGRFIRRWRASSAAV